MNPNPVRLLPLLLLPLAFAGCQLFGLGEEVQGHPVDAQYSGLAGKSVALVLYADQATTNEYPAAREELSAFIASKLREKIPTCKLLDSREVTNWQDDTINWFGLTEKQIGKHFSVDRVIYIEILDYSVASQKSFGALQGHLRANCKIDEVDSPSNAPAWSTVMDIHYPDNHPVDAAGTDPEALRASLLEKFADKLTDAFYDHHEYNHNAD